jgi:hypothetical protein
VVKNVTMTDAEAAAKGVTAAITAAVAPLDT